MWKQLKKIINCETVHFFPHLRRKYWCKMIFHLQYKKVQNKKKTQTTHTLSTILICLRCNKSLSVWIFMITCCQIKTIRPISLIRIDPMKKKILEAFFFRQIITFYKSTHSGSVISWLPLASRLRLERYRNIRIFLSTDLSF